MTVKEIKQGNAITPYCFNSDNEEEWYNSGLLHGVEIAENELINKVCEYLKAHIWQTTDADGDPIIESVKNITKEDFIKDLKRVIEE